MVKYKYGDSSNININSNVNFILYDEIILPKNCKIDVLETDLIYNISDCNKKILVNGKDIPCTNNLLNDYIMLNKNLINIPKDKKKEILFSLVEYLNLEIECTLNIKTRAYLDSGEILQVNAIGKYTDHLKTILMNEFSLSYGACNLNNFFIQIDSLLLGNVKPNFVFLSPIFDCNSNIIGFIGNVFSNYNINFKLFNPNL